MQTDASSIFSREGIIHTYCTAIITLAGVAGLVTDAYMSPGTTGGALGLPPRASLNLAANTSCTKSLTLDSFALDGWPADYFLGYGALTSLTLQNLQLTGLGPDVLRPLVKLNSL